MNVITTNYRPAYIYGKARPSTAGEGFRDHMALSSVARADKAVYMQSSFGVSMKGKMVYETLTADTYESDHYKIVADKSGASLYFDIYNKLGEHLGVFEYNDVKIKHDTMTGKDFLISEHGTMSYDALVLDEEMKADLCGIMGVDSLETETLQGFSLKTHTPTGIQYLLKDGEEGIGGKILLQSEEDVKKFEALAEIYLNKYPNLIKDQNAAYIWADFEIRGLAQHTEHGILSINRDGISYADNADGKKNWSILFSGDTYLEVGQWIKQHGEHMQEMDTIASWKWLFKSSRRAYGIAD